MAPGERRELVEVGQPAMGPDGRYRGTWRHGNYVDAMVNVEGRGYSIRRVALSDQSPAERQRAHRLAARSLTEMNALTAIARRPARAVPVPAREAERPSAHQRRPASLGTRTPASQRGAARALFGSAPSTSETAQLRILAASSGGLLLDVAVLTASLSTQTGRILGAHLGPLAMAVSSWHGVLAAPLPLTSLLPF